MCSVNVLNDWIRMLALSMGKKGWFKRLRRNILWEILVYMAF